MSERVVYKGNPGIAKFIEMPSGRVCVQFERDDPPEGECLSNAVTFARLRAGDNATAARRLAEEDGMQFCE